MSNVRILPGVNRADLMEATSTQSVLEDAMKYPLIDVVVVGRSASGEIEVWGSMADADKTLGLLLRGSNWLAAAEQITDDSELGE